MMTVTKLSNLQSLRRMWESSLILFLKQLPMIRKKNWFFRPMKH